MVPAYSGLTVWDHESLFVRDESGSSSPRIFKMLVSFCAQKIRDRRDLQKTAQAGSSH